MKNVAMKFHSFATVLPAFEFKAVSKRTFTLKSSAERFGVSERRAEEGEGEKTSRQQAALLLLLLLLPPAPSAPAPTPAPAPSPSPFSARRPPTEPAWRGSGRAAGLRPPAARPHGSAGLGTALPPLPCPPFPCRAAGGGLPSFGTHTRGRRRGEEGHPRTSPGTAAMGTGEETPDGSPGARGRGRGGWSWGRGRVGAGGTRRRRQPKAGLCLPPEGEGRHSRQRGSPLSPGGACPWAPGLAPCCRAWGVLGEFIRGQSLKGSSPAAQSRESPAVARHGC